MADAASLIRSLLSLGEIELRVAWLDDRLKHASSAASAEVLNALCEQNERSVPSAREATLAVALLLARLGDSELLDALRTHATEGRLLSLDRLVRKLPDPLPSLTFLETPQVPDYGAGRELTVGERRSLARKPNRHAFEKLMSDPHPLVIRQLLENPRLTEDDVIHLAARRPARPEIFQELRRSSRWLCARRARFTIVLNPRTPSTLALPLLHVLSRSELREVLDSSEARPALRTVALELLGFRPPLEEEDSFLLQ